MSGKVYLVGAGPGDPELLTLKGRRVLGEAEVVVYDRLANPRLLAHAPAAARRIYAGKGGTGTPLTQEEINALLVEHARAGRVVCRLKGGDPFVFGRGGEEAEALAAAGLPWEYVPGITSAIAAPGYAGIPVTHRGLARAVTVVTGHEDPGSGQGPEWELLARGTETLVLLMGVERLEALVARLLEHGRSPETPAAVVSWGTYARQQTVAAPLGQLAARCREAGCTAPAVAVIGPVAALRSRLNWWETLPLFGKRIVVTRAAAQAEELAALLEAAGAEALRCPVLEVRRLPAPDLSVLDGSHHWVVFTSANGVYSLAEALREARRDVRALGPARVAAIGGETAAAAREAGLYVDFVPGRAVAEQVLAEFPEPVAGRRLLLVRAREARELLPDEWRRAGAEVCVLPVYETVAARPTEDVLQALREELTAGRIDAVTFTSSSSVRHFAALFPPPLPRATCVACLGPVTARTAREFGFAVQAVAEEQSAAGLVRALHTLYSPPGP